MEPIQYIGLEELNKAERDILDTLSTEYYDKIQLELKNITSLVIHIKAYDKEGLRKKWTINIKAIAPTQIFQSTKAVDWDLARTLHKAFKDLERQIIHQLKVDDQKPKHQIGRKTTIRKVRDKEVVE